MKRHLLFVLMLLASAAFTLHAEGEIIVNGQTITGKTVKQILFDRENITVIYDDDSQDAEINTADISLLPVSGVQSVKVYSFTALAGKGELNISGLDEKSAVDIYDINGRALKHIAKPQGDKLTVDISSLQHGVYLLRNGNNVIKFTVK